MSGYYDTAQICLNGHVTNDNFRKYPVHNTDHCPKCGEPTIVQCPSCKSDIRGSYEIDGVFAVGGEFPAPAFCHKCGNAYPWTEKRLQAAKALADEFDELSSDEKEKLKGSLDALVRESAMTEVAGVRFKKIMKKLGKESYEGMKNILTDIASETIKKTIFGG